MTTEEKTYSFEEAEALTGIPAETLRTKRKRREILCVQILKGSRMIWHLPESTIQTLKGEKDSASYKQLFDDWSVALASGYLTGNPLDPDSVTNYHYGFKRFWRYYGKKEDIKHLTADNVRAALALYPVDYIKRSCSYESKMQTLKAVRSFCSYLVEKKLMDALTYHQIKDIKVKRKFPPRRTSVTQEKFKQLLNQNNRMRGKTEYDRVFTETIMKLMTLSGVRRKEVINLQVGHVDLQRRILHVVDGKGHKDRDVYINSALAEQLELWLGVRLSSKSDALMIRRDGKPVTKYTIRHKVERVKKAAGIDITPHGFRRSFGTFMSEGNVPIDMVRDQLGHASLETTRKYLMTTSQQVISYLRTNDVNIGMDSIFQPEVTPKTMSMAEKLALLERLQS